jgi:hypothetical protein
VRRKWKFVVVAKVDAGKYLGYRSDLRISKGRTYENLTCIMKGKCPKFTFIKNCPSVKVSLLAQCGVCFPLESVIFHTRSFPTGGAVWHQFLKRQYSCLHCLEGDKK